MGKTIKQKAMKVAIKDIQKLINELLSESGETHEELRIKTGLTKCFTKNLRQGKIYSLPLFYKIAIMYGKKVKISFE